MAEVLACWPDQMTRAITTKGAIVVGARRHARPGRCGVLGRADRLDRLERGRQGDRDVQLEWHVPLPAVARLRRGRCPRCVFVMANPSTADHLVLGPTVRRRVAFARSWGYGALEVVSAFALRSTDLDGLRAIEDRSGRETTRRSWRSHRPDRSPSRRGACTASASDARPLTGGDVDAAHGRRNRAPCLARDP